MQRPEGAEMRKVIADEWMTLDGVIQAPGQADEDTTGGFQHGGWHVGYFDDIAQRQVVDSVATAGGFLLGRRTYEIFAAHWPTASEEEQVLAEPLNTSRSTWRPGRSPSRWRGRTRGCSRATSPRPWPR
jgi:dihydrofolate reductase